VLSCVPRQISDLLFLIDTAVVASFSDLPAWIIRGMCRSKKLRQSPNDIEIFLAKSLSITRGLVSKFVSYLYDKLL
jgi:hypothetical protein